MTTTTKNQNINLNNKFGYSGDFTYIYNVIKNKSKMEKEFVPYEQALALKQLGFDEPCFNRFYTKPQSKIFGVDEKGRHYPIKNTSKKLYTMGEHFVLNDSNVILAPLYQQAFRWFREKYGLFIQPNRTIDSEGTWYYFSIASKRTDVCDGSFVYEEAELECLIKLIEIVKNENK